MPSKQIKKPEFVKHPFSKKRLRVIDSFATAKPGLVEFSDTAVIRESQSPPKSAARCPACQGDVDKIMAVESDCKSIAMYYVVNCSSCNKMSWFIEGPKPAKGQQAQP